MVEAIKRGDPPHRDRALAYLWGCCNIRNFSQMSWSKKVDCLQCADFDGEIEFDPGHIPGGDLSAAAEAFRKSCGKFGIMVRSWWSPSG